MKKILLVLVLILGVGLITTFKAYKLYNALSYKELI